ncbi:Protein Tanc2 [Manis pentadactyla]|nr:Protein Tanc2 [Manis pentadactyla]
MLMVAETLALRKELGSGSDETGVQDVGSGLWVRVSCEGMSMHVIRLRREFLVNSDVKCRIQTPGLGLELDRH